MDTKSRKLHVADTLAKATRALEAHRSWIKRRAAAVTPLEVDDNDTYSATVSVDNTSGYFGGPYTDQCVGNTNQKLIQNQSRLRLQKHISSESSRSTVQGCESLNFSNSPTMNYRTNWSQAHKSEGRAKIEVWKKLSPVSPTNVIGSSHLVQSPTSIEMFMKAEKEELSSLPTARNAWGSQPSRLDCSFLELTALPVSSDSVSILKPSRLSGEVLQESGDSQSQISCDQPQFEESINLESATESRESSFETAHIDELQLDTHATVISVSPAPRNQQSTYAAHTQSKLMAADSNVELLDDLSETRRQISSQQDGYTILGSSGRAIASHQQMVPKAILQRVLPKQDQTVMGSLQVIPSTVPDSQMKLSDVTSSRIEFSTANSPPQTRDVSNTLPCESISSPNLNIVASISCDSEGLNQKQQPTLPTRVMTGVNLPPLKRHEIDGNKIVQELPPLKFLPSPLLSPLLNEHSLSQEPDLSPPPYFIHQSQAGSVLAPPCPMYGSVEVSSTEVLNSHSVTFDSVFESTLAPTTSLQKTDVSYCLNSEEHKNIPSRPNIKNDLVSHFEDAEISKTFRVYGERGLSLSAGTNKGESLIQSSSENHEIIVSQLPLGPGALHLAAKSGNLRLVHALLHQGHDIDLPDHEGRTPLMYCIQSQGVHLSCADTLIREGANVNKQTLDGFTAIHLAASVGAVSLIELMLLNGADPDIRDFEGRLPIHWAMIQKGSKTISLLHKHSNYGINVTDDAGMTPLMWAAYNNNVWLTSFLLDNGADCEEKDIDGYTAMHWAIHRESTRCLQLLLQPDRTYFKDHKGRTVFHLAVEKGAIEACELILKMRVDVIFDTDKNGRTPLHYASACSRVDVCALLLDKGCDASQRDLTGRSPLDYARIKKLDYVVALLTCHGSAVADFARASRTTSVSTFLNRSLSFSELPQAHTRYQHSSEDNSSNVLSQSLSTLNVHKKSLVKESEQSDGFSQRSGTSASVVDSTNVAEESGTQGGYLGRFFFNNTDPVQHFYFWLKSSNGALCWCRYRENASHSATRNEATILEIFEGPSNSVKQNPSYSPEDLHKYVFWVMTGSGVLDLFAYNQDAYTRWVDNIRDLAEKNKRDQERNICTSSRISSMPLSSTTRLSNSSVVPAWLDHEESGTPSPVIPSALKPKETEVKMDTEGFSRRGISISPTSTSTPLQTNNTSNTSLRNKEPGFLASNLNTDNYVHVPMLALEESDVI